MSLDDGMHDEDAPDGGWAADADPAGSAGSRVLPARDLAEGFAAQVRRWALRLGAGAAEAARLQQAARALCLATTEGHVCIALDDLDPPGGDDDGAPAPADPGAHAAAWRATLRRSGLCGTPEAPGGLPLILDDDGRLYLHRDFDLERRLAVRLMRAARAAATPPAGETAALLQALFAANERLLAGSVDWQRVAAALALRGRLTVISGGPGTGKTTTVVNLLACLLAQQPQARIVLAAPTGKAAARMSEAIRDRAGHLPEALRARLPTQSYTVHRLLGVLPGSAGFVHHAGHPLALDVLVVDEASMLDLALATRLLEAVPPQARIVLLGDKDQLAAVESGAVFSELSADPSLSPAARASLAPACGQPAEALVAPAPARASVLHDSVVWFTRNFRFAADSAIGRLAADINAARGADALAALRDGHDPALRWWNDAGPAPGPQAWQRVLDGQAPYLDAVRRDPQDHDSIAAAFAGFRVLCAVQAGPRGVAEVNQRLERHARDRLDGLAARDSRTPRAEATPWFTGRPVMVLRNDPLLRLFNGDIGFTLPDAQGRPMVWFPADGGRWRAIAPLRLPAHQTAFAMTVHKSQGSEFDEVLLLLPAQRHRVLSRELLYTAVTRARSRVGICAPAAVIAAAIGAPTRRRSGLLARLAEAHAALGRGR